MACSRWISDLVPWSHGFIPTIDLGGVQYAKGRDFNYLQVMVASRTYFAGGSGLSWAIKVLQDVDSDLQQLEGESRVPSGKLT